MWEIYAYHNTESLFGIFNAIAAIMASGTYLGAVAAVAFCGFVAAMVAYMFAPEKLQGWKWIGSVILVYGVLFVPRVNVGIVDKTGGAPVRVVGNVPFGMAALGGLTSSIGNSITELFETAFQVIPGPAALPAELSYQQNGLMFGSRLVQETRRASIPDPALRTDLVNFVNNCTAFDLADGSIAATAFSTTDDLWPLMAATNPARFSIVTTPIGVTTTTCDQAYRSIDGRLPAQVTDLTNRLGLRLNPSLTALAARAAVVSQIPQAYIRSQIAAAAATAADLVRQNAMINAINDAGEMGCQKTSDPSCMMLATGRAAAVASQNAAWINGAKIAEQALPVVRNVAEAMSYAVFPLIVLLLFLTSGRNTVLMLAGYASALVSIQLWPPLFAILNYMASIYAQLDQAAAAEIGGGVKALSLQTASPIYSNAVSAQAVVAYLVVGIPPLAYALANRLVNFGSTLIGGLSGLQSTVGNASAASALGNSSMGNVSMDQQVLSPSSSNPWVSRSQDERGNWWTADGSGRKAVSLLRNEGITSHQVSARVSQSDVDAASRSTSAAATEVLAAASTQSSSLTEALSRVRQRTSSSRASSGQSVSGYEEASKAAESLSAEARRVAKETGYDESQVAGTLLRFAAMPSAFGLGGGAVAEKRYGASLSEAEKKILDHTSSDTYRTVQSFGDRVSRDQAFLNALASEGQSGVSLASSLVQTRNRTESAERRFSEALSRSEETRLAFERGESITRDLALDPAYADAVMDYERAATQFGSNTQSLAAYFSSRLGNYALNPIRVAETSAVPTTFSAVRDFQTLHAQDGAVNPDLEGSRTANDQHVRLGHLDPPPTAPSVEAPGIPAAPPPTVPSAPVPASLRPGAKLRTDVGQRGQNQVQASAAPYQSFDERHQLKRAPDGGVSTHQSLIGTTAKNLERDGETVYEDFVAAADRQAAEARQRLAGSDRQQAIDATPDVPPMSPKGGRRQRKP